MLDLMDCWVSRQRPVPSQARTRAGVQSPTWDTAFLHLLCTFLFCLDQSIRKAFLLFFSHFLLDPPNPTPDYSWVSFKKSIGDHVVSFPLMPSCSSWNKLQGFTMTAEAFVFLSLPNCPMLDFKLLKDTFLAACSLCQCGTRESCNVFSRWNGCGLVGRV